MAEEKQFENKVKKMLSEKGVWFFKVWGGLFQKAGIPDIVGCCNGHFIALEIKASNGRPSKLQMYVINKIKQAGGYARFVYPNDYWELIQELNNLLTK